MDDIFELTTFDNISQLVRPKMDWLEMLNPEQKHAVETTEGPLLVLSGAGTGKTKVLTTRLAYILSLNKARPHECLVVTFTNRAAREMKDRVFGMIGEIADMVWLGTFHSVCAKILRNHAEIVDLKSNFTILGEDDQKRVIKQILEQENIDDKKYPPQSILDRIQRWKDKGLTPDKISQDSPVYSHVYKLYQTRLIELNCVDFGDIILHCLNILLAHQDILERYQTRFKYIMVDEYQDTNVSQYLFLRLLSQKHRNLCCVGDDDQSIYSWRGAEVENILRFEKDFPDAQIIRLERNYRSTANILEAASCLISNNQGRLGKELKVAENSPAQNIENTKVKVISNYNGLEEAKYVVDEIENNLRKGFQYSDMAVLVRTAFQTREFEEKFITEAIPYQVVGGLKFYDRAEIKDALAYFRVILQSGDDLAFERIINRPTRGIGAKSVENFYNLARFERISLYEAAKKSIETGKGKLKSSLENLIGNFEKWRLEANSLTPDDLASLVLEDSGYLDMLRNDKSPDAPGKIENLKELMSVMGDTDKFINLGEFMEHVSLVMDKDDENNDNRVKLITLHSAKGLEFDIVFLPGWEEGLFPHQRAMDEGGQESLEEERRLAYVAITRAKKQLYILTALTRRVYGEYRQNTPSRFINELPPSNIELYNNSSYNYFSDHTSQITDYNDEVIGRKVYHQTFGYGTIRKVDGNKFGIYFFNNGYKMIMSDYVKVV